MFLSIGIYLLSLINVSVVMIIVVILYFIGLIVFFRRVDQQKVFSQVAERSRNPLMLIFIILTPLFLLAQAVVMLFWNTWPLLVNASLSALNLVSDVLIVVALSLMIAGAIYNIRGLRVG
jgi:hypothetical protein